MEQEILQVITQSQLSDVVMMLFWVFGGIGFFFILSFWVYGYFQIREYRNIPTLRESLDEYYKSHDPQLTDEEREKLLFTLKDIDASFVSDDNLYLISSIIHKLENTK